MLTTPPPPPNVLLLVVISSLSLAVPYAYKFSRDIYFTNASHLTIFAILISRMAACSCKLVPYACKFSGFYFCESPLIREIRENKVPQNLYAYGMSAHGVPVQLSTFQHCYNSAGLKYLYETTCLKTSLQNPLGGLSRQDHPIYIVCSFVVLLHNSVIRSPERLISTPSAVATVRVCPEGYMYCHKVLPTSNRITSCPYQIGWC